MLRLGFKLALFVPLLLGIAWVSYSADPGGLFVKNTDYFRMLEALSSGKSVVIDRELDQRRLKQLWIARPKHQPATALVGSSRSMYVTEKHFKPDTFFNEAVPSGGMPDFLDFYLQHEDANTLPRRVIWELSPFTLPGDMGLFRRDNNENLSRYEQLSKRTEHSGIFPALELRRNRGLALLTPSYYQSSAALFFKGKGTRQPGGFTAVTNDAEAHVPEQGSIIHPDGSIFSPGIYRAYTPAAIERYAREMGETYVAQKMGDIPPESWEFFKEFVRHVKSRGVRVAFFLPPYHPLTYGILKRSGQVEKFELRIREFAAEEKLDVYGSCDPARFELTEADFFDGHHPKTSALDRIFSSK
jgi:hypothetical protein